MMRKLAAGNWKMNGGRASLAEIETIATDLPRNIDVLICPPATLLPLVKAKIALGGQDCHIAENGAHTGDISAEMLKDAGASYVILGHSERRADHGEMNPAVKAKAEAAQRAGLIPIICIGETLAEREAGRTLNVVKFQLARSLPESPAVVVAYEPVWAIGTGKVPTLEQIAEVHSFLRARLVQRFGIPGNDIPLLYGGSVKPANAAEIFAVPNVDGALVGGASLKACDFKPIIAALAATDRSI
ncbi:MAG: triose-phosphate isomerase [Deltaproteobacteria bacterium]